MPTAGSETAVTANKRPQTYTPSRFMIPTLAYISMLRKPSSWKNKKIKQSIKHSQCLFIVYTINKTP
jgi:hypothetical protein